MTRQALCTLEDNNTFEFNLNLFHLNRSNWFDGVFHTNCFYFWSDMTRCCAELYRVLKPGGKMIATMNFQRLKTVKDQGHMKYGNMDPIRYMSALEGIGFKDVRIEYLKDDTEGEYSAIYSHVGEKVSLTMKETNDKGSTKTSKESSTDSGSTESDSMESQKIQL